MPSLDDVVRAMTNQSTTMKWDVVVNYSVEELNKLLKDSYQSGVGQLTTFQTKLTGYDEDDDPYNIDYNFEFGTPLLQFDPYAVKPACSLTIPIVGGTVKTRKTWTIPSGIYSITISGILLSSINDTDRTPQSSDQPFTFPSTPGTTGIVTLDIITSESKNSLVVDMDISPSDPDKHVHKIDSEKGNLVESIRDFFKDPHQVSDIRWDLARVNNIHPSTGSPQLVPKSFRFAVYTEENNETNGVLSVFIQTADTQYGDQKKLQDGWSKQWADYGVSPIPSSHSASIIFSSRMILDMINTSLSDQKMKGEPQPGNGFKWKVLTHKQFVLPPMSKRDIDWDGGSSVGYNGAKVDLDENPLYVTLGQNGNPSSTPSAQMEWSFQYSTDWWEDVATMGGDSNTGGTLRISNSLKTGITKRVDDSDLANYVVRFDLGLSTSDWATPDVKADQPDFWGRITGQTGWTPDWFGKDLPSLPTLKVKLIDFDFFLTTNLVLPSAKVITFESSPGVRIPQDVYLVGNVVKKN